MKTRTFTSLTSVVTVIIALVIPAQAISVCYDYVYWRVTGTDSGPVGASKYSSEGDVIDALRKKGYEPLSGPDKPGLDGKNLRKNDVIIMTKHIGIADGPNSISHYIQCLEVNNPHPISKPYNVRNLPLAQPRGNQCRAGGFYQGSTLREFLTTPSWALRQGAENITYQVWRQTCKVPPTVVGQFTLTGNPSGLLVIRSQSGNHVEGNYSNDAGSLVNTVKGDFKFAIDDQCTLEGTFENKQYKTNGKFTYIFTKDGTRFSGTWRHADGGLSGTWNGTKK